MSNNEYTPTREQVDAALVAFTCDTMEEWDEFPENYKETLRGDMCAALVAAAGATPQEREDENLARASAWSDYRAEYGVHGAQSHRDFCAGWDAARGTLDTGRGQR